MIQDSFIEHGEGVEFREREEADEMLADVGYVFGRGFLKWRGAQQVKRQMIALRPSAGLGSRMITLPSPCPGPGGEPALFPLQQVAQILAAIRPVGCSESTARTS